MLLYKIYTFVPKFPVFSNLYTDHLRTFFVKIEQLVPADLRNFS